MADGNSANEMTVKQQLEDSARVDLARILDAHRGERHLVVLQDFPDPDGISSAFAHQIISAEFDIAVDIVYHGRISHLQNVALVKLLGIDLIRYTSSLDLEQYAGEVARAERASLLGLRFLVARDCRRAPAPVLDLVRNGGGAAPVPPPTRVRQRESSELRDSRGDVRER